MCENKNVQIFENQLIFEQLFCPSAKQKEEHGSRNL